MNKKSNASTVPPASPQAIHYEEVQKDYFQWLLGRFPHEIEHLDRKAFLDKLAQLRKEQKD
jgi:peptide deformylase